MADWAELSKKLEDVMRLKTRPVAYKRFEKAEELDEIDGIFRPFQSFTYCQIPFMVRAMGVTMGISRGDLERLEESGPQWFDRCMRLHGLRDADEESMKREAAALSTTWFGSPDDAMVQQHDYPRIPAGEAIIVGPLDEARFEPDVVSIYANPAQIMMILCGLQKDKYERFDFSFIGEGACADSLARCYVTGKPALAIPCYGERALGQVADDEIVLALPPAEIERSLGGLKKLADVGLKYPVQYIGGMADVGPILSRLYS